MLFFPIEFEMEHILRKGFDLMETFFWLNPSNRINITENSFAQKMRPKEQN